MAPPIARPAALDAITTTLTTATETIKTLLARADVAATSTTSSTSTPTSDVNFGTGVIPARKFNNAGFLALFAILGAALVILSIWFFFWARNGGFRWEKEDWDDYKSTVLRQSKDENGRSIVTVARSRVMRELADEENARRQKAIEAGFDHTPLGSAVDSYTEKSSPRRAEHNNFARSYQQQNGGNSRPNSHTRPSSHSHPNSRPNSGGDVVMQYRDEEQPARVGGLNKPSDSSRFDPSSGSYVNSQQSRSVASGGSKDTGAAKSKSSARDGTKKKSKSGEKADKKEKKDRERERRPTTRNSTSSNSVSTPPPTYSRPVSGANRSPVSTPRAAHRASHVSASPTATTTTTSTPSGTASSYYASYRAAAAVHDAARGGLPTSGAPIPTPAAATAQQPQRSSFPPSATTNNRFMRNGPKTGNGVNRLSTSTIPGAPSNRAAAAPEDDDERLSHLLPVGEIHPNESASQIGTRAYWTAKRDSAKAAENGGAAGGYRRYSRT